MSRFTCDGSYKDDLRVYEERGLTRFGVSSQTAEREAMCLAEEGNTVACKLCADLIFYKKILCHRPYREAFALYMKAAGLEAASSGSWQGSGRAYPLAYWSVAYYLVHYHRDSFLKDCEAIQAIDAMTETERLKTALELVSSCLTYLNAPEAANLAGLILVRVAENEAVYEALSATLAGEIAGRAFPMIGLEIGAIASAADCAPAAEQFFKAAADEGYAYACNNLAAREADKIVELSTSGASDKELDAMISRYVHYLQLAADKYEPYASNRLGLFYMTGEIRGAAGAVTCRRFCNTSLAKTYFTKATRYPDANAAWGFFNLIKYFQKDYDTNIELMNEHMDRIKELNPKVYDIAMDL